MSRIIDSEFATASKADNLKIAVLLFLDFDSAPVYLNTSATTIVYDGNSYLGAGQLGSISRVEEKAEIESSSIELALSGIPTEYISLSLQEKYQGRPVKIYLALLDSNFVVIGTPLTLFVGKMDYMQVVLGESATISVVCNSILSDWNRPRVRRYNNEDQQIEYPLDKGFKFVQQEVEQEIVWGQNSLGTTKN